MRNPSSYLISEDPDPTKSLGGRVITEQDFYFCCHCGSHRQVAPFVQPLAFCRKCMMPHCDDRPTCFVCTPIVGRHEAEEKAARPRLIV